MLRNFIIIALRQMRRNKIFSFINIAGLSVGVACCLILVLYVQDDLSYDRHHADVDRLYRITTSFNINDYKPVPRTSPPIAWTIKDEVPEFETVTRIVAPPGASQNLVKYEDKQFYEPDGVVADSTLFDILTYEFIAGNPKTALREANSVVICEALATKLFGNEPALNKVININQGGPAADFTVTGVMRNNMNSHVKANFFVSSNSSGWAEYIRRGDVIDEWAGQNFMNSYVKLRPGSDVEAAIAKMNTVFQKHGADDMKALGMQKRLGLEAVRDIYMYSAAEKQQPRVTYLYVVCSIAAFILLIACINFMNLSTAKAAQRAVEVGLRKTLGAPRSLLIRQFLSETLIIVVVALLISCILIPLVLPAFNQLTDKHITLATADLGFIALCLAGIAVDYRSGSRQLPRILLVVVPAGGNIEGPARAAIGGRVSASRTGSVSIRYCHYPGVRHDHGDPGSYGSCRSRILVSAQHIRSYCPCAPATRSRIILALRDALAGQAAVTSITATDAVPGTPMFSDLGVYPTGGSMEKAVLTYRNAVEPNYLDVMKLKLVAGRNFGEERNSDSWKRVIINREGAKQLGMSAGENRGREITRRLAE